MKSKEICRWLINPFTRIAGWQALAIGIAVMIATSLTGYYSQVIFDGVLDIHLAKVSLGTAFIYPFASQLIFIICVWLFAKLFTHGFRFIDVAGTLTLARTPMLLAALLGFATGTPAMEDIMADPMMIFNQTGFLISLFGILAVEVWTIVLIVNAIKISCDLRSSKLAGLTIISLFIAEFLAKVLFMSVNMHSLTF